MQISLEMKVSSFCEMRQKFEVARHECRQLLGQLKKIELAANNGDTLGEAVVSVEGNKFRLGRQRKFQLKKQQPENRTNIIIYHLFQRCFKDANQ